MAVGEEILSDLDAFFSCMKENSSPCAQLLAHVILRSARDWFKGRNSDPDSDDPKVRNAHEYACGAYNWFMDDKDFFGRMEPPHRSRGVISFRAACSYWGLDPGRFRTILDINTMEELEHYRGRERGNSRK